MNNTLFSPVGLAYAERIGDLEAAREIFASERDKTLERLGATLPTSMPAKRKREGLVESYYFEKSLWQAERDRRSFGGRAGFCFTIHHKSYFGQDGHLAFWAYVFFEIGPKGFRSLPPEIPGLSTQPLQHKFGYARGLYMHVPLGADGFAIEGLENAVRDLPRVFATANEALTKAYVKARPFTGSAEEDGDDEEEPSGQDSLLASE